MNDSQLIFEAYTNMPPQMPPHLLEEGAWDNIKNWWLDPERGPIQWIKKNPKKVAAAGGIIVALGVWYGLDADTAQGLVDASGGAEALSGGADIFNDPNWSSAIEQLVDYGFTEDQIGEIASNIDFPNDNQEVLDAANDYLRTTTGSGAESTGPEWKLPRDGNFTTQPGEVVDPADKAMIDKIKPVDPSRYPDIDQRRSRGQF